jgi:hypothetical protein
MQAQQSTMYPSQPTSLASAQEMQLHQQQQLQQQGRYTGYGLQGGGGAASTNPNANNGNFQNRIGTLPPPSGYQPPTTAYQPPNTAMGGYQPPQAQQAQQVRGKSGGPTNLLDF